MIYNEQIPTVLEHPVHDMEGSKIGDASSVFVDDATGQPDWASVRTGLFKRKEAFVPLRDATVIEGHLAVPYDKEQVLKAPPVTVDAGGHLSEREERRLCRHYGISWNAAQRRQHGR